MKGFISLLLVFLVLVSSVARNITWTDPVSLNADTLNKSPFKARPHYGAALIFFNTGEADRALYHLNMAERFLKNAALPRKNDIYLLYGNIAKEKGMDEAAIGYYEEALKHDYYSDYTLGAIVVMLADKGRINEAGNYLSRLANRHPSKFLTKMASGYFYLAVEMPVEAARYLSEAVGLNPDSAEAYMKRARAYQMLGREKDAKADVARAKKIYAKLFSDLPANIGARKAFALGLAEVGDFNEAEAQFRYLIDKNNDDPELHNNLGSLLAMQGRFGEALGHFQRTIELRPGAVEPYLNMADALESLGRLEEAQKYRLAAERKK